MENKGSIMMADFKNGASSTSGVAMHSDNERSSLITKDQKSSNPSSTSDSFSPKSNGWEESKDFPNTEELDRSLYMDNTTTWFTSLIHIIKGNIGIGALSLPLAMANTGIVVGPILLLLTAVVVLYCMLLLIKCNHALCNRNKILYLGYAQVAEMSISLYYPEAGYLSRVLVNTFLVFTQLGFCCVYFIFVSQNLQQVFIDNIELDVRIWVVIIALPVILVSYIHTLKVLTVVSLLANVLYFVGVLCILIYAGETINDHQALPKFVGFSTWPIAFGLFVFSLEGIGVVLPIENVMALPRKACCVLTIGMVTVILIILFLGTIGFLSCGMHCLGSITLNLPNTLYYSTVKMTFAVAIFFTYFIQFYVPMAIIIPPLQEKLNEKYRTLVDYGIRTLAVCTTALFAIGAPDLGAMISLVGSIGCTSLAIIFPPIIHILIFSYDKKLSTSSLVLDIVVVVFGVLGALSGMYSSIISIMWDNRQTVSLPNSTLASL